MRSRRTLAAAFAAFTALSLAAPAAAQDNAADDTNVTVSPGILYIEGGAIETFGTHAITGTPFNLDTAVAAVEVGDLRGNGLGYTVSAQATQFTTSSAPTRTLGQGSLTLDKFTGTAGRNDTDSPAPALA